VVVCSLVLCVIADRAEYAAVLDDLAAAVKPGEHFYCTYLSCFVINFQLVDVCVCRSDSRAVTCHWWAHCMLQRSALACRNAVRLHAGMCALRVCRLLLLLSVM
jgi:hypothetical protein